MNTYNITDFSKQVGLAVKTLQRWDREGKLKPKRSPTNRRIYTDEHLAKFFQLQKPASKNKKIVVYARVSSASQKSDLKNQREALESFCTGRGYAVDEWVDEIGGGLNFKRRKFLKIIDGVLTGRIGVLVIAHKDRLARFGLDLIRHLCKTNDCELIIMNTESLSPEQELVEDLLAVTHTFSARLYGLRNYKKKLKEALESDKIA